MSLENARITAKDLGHVIREAESDLAKMPFFVRAMVKKGFARRTGRSHADWAALAVRLESDLERADALAGVLSQQPRLIGELERLAENFRSAPERAGRFMKGAQLDRVKASSKERARRVRALVEALSG